MKGFREALLQVKDGLTDAQVHYLLQRTTVKEIKEALGLMVAVEKNEKAKWLLEKLYKNLPETVFVSQSELKLDPQKYVLKMQIYTSEAEITREFNSFKDGLFAAELLSELAKTLGWTRHRGVTGLVRHLSNYHDLFNEGSIVLG
jgi:hypothetical protein